MCQINKIAKKYVEAGFSVVPIKQGQKAPFVKWEEYQHRLPTNEELDSWFTSDKINIGIVTGELSGITVVDIDAVSGGLETLKDLGLPITWTVKTGGGGWHYYYKYDKRAGQTQGFYQGIDIRNDGGQVVAPPSLHKTGNRYEWTYKEDELVDFPIHLFKKEEVTKKKNWSEFLSGSGEGTRNGDASSVFGKLMTIYRPEEWESIVWDIGLYWNNNNTPPLEESELRSVYNSIAKRAINNVKPTMQEILSSNETPNEIAKGIKKYNSNFYTWGDAMLDEQLPLLENNTYCVLFGQQGSGKTTYALYQARRNAETKNKVIFLSLEMPKEKLVRQYAFKRQGISKEDYKAGNYEEDIFAKYAKELNNIEFVGIDENKKKSEYTVKDLEEIIKERQPNVIYIDNLNKLKSSKKDDLQRDADVSEQLLFLTRQYKVCVVLIHHANKPLNDKKNKILRGLSGLRGSNKINDDADIVCEVGRPNANLIEQGYNKNLTSLAVYKDRDWDTRCMINLIFNKGNFYDEATYVEDLSDLVTF